MLEVRILAPVVGIGVCCVHHLHRCVAYPRGCSYEFAMLLCSRAPLFLSLVLLPRFPCFECGLPSLADECNYFEWDSLRALVAVAEKRNRVFVRDRESTSRH